MSIKVLIADDSAVVRQAIRRVLDNKKPEIEVVGEAADYAQTVQMKNDLKPQVILLDIHMPDEKRIDLKNVGSQLNHGSQILAISLWRDADAQALAKLLGAATLLDKAELGTSLVPAIMQLAGVSEIGQSLVNSRNSNKSYAVERLSKLESSCLASRSHRYACCLYPHSNRSNRTSRRSVQAGPPAPSARQVPVPRDSES
jgi:DNA-binding NarL/FixJ family response regulator